MTGEHSKCAHNNPPRDPHHEPGAPQENESKTPASSEASSAADRITRIRQLNDRLRREGRGGLIHMTNGVAALGLPTVDVIFACIADFIGFTPDNDPWDEHDCAVMTILDHRIIWKIDYYDRTRTYHSPDPADPKVTVRVMTVMLADEY
jgi:Protein of unknown function (DUF3768)